MTEPVDVLAQHLAGALLDIERLVAENGALQHRVGVLEAALMREASAPSVADERVAIVLKPTPKQKPHVGTKPVGLPQIAVGPPAAAAHAKRRRPHKLTTEEIERWARVKFA